MNGTKLKVLNIHDYPPVEGGGVEVNVYSSSKELLNLGYEVTIATSRLSSETYSNVDLSDHNVGGIKIYWIKTLEQLKNLILQHDIVHIHFTFSFRPASLLGLQLCTELNKPCIFSFTTAYEHYPFSAIFTEPPIEQDKKFHEVINNAKKDNVLLCAPSFCIEDTLRKLNIDKKLNVVRNGCTVIDSQITQTMNVDDVDITYVGELSFLKGVNYLIDAVRILKNNNENIKVRLIGDGSSATEMKRLVSFHQLESNFEFTGYVKNGLIPEYLAHTKIMVHPSLTESWGCSVVEALSMGIPVICTKVGGLIDATNNGDFATLVDKANASELAKSIKYSLNKQNLAKLKQKALIAKEFIRKNYTLSNQAKQLDDLYTSALKVKTKSKT